MRSFASLPPAARTDPDGGSSGIPDGHGGTVDGAGITWRRRPGTTAFDARIRASGDNGLHDVRQAYDWLHEQFAAGALHVEGDDTPRRRTWSHSAFTITYRESWT